MDYGVHGWDIRGGTNYGDREPADRFRGMFSAT
jgi:hypothetical protein